MKIAVLGSAPSSILKAPFGDASWEIWACSPGAYPHLARISEFFEVHRWEPGVVGKPQTQKPWFTPEYVQWLKSVPPVVWVADPDAAKDIGERSKMLPIDALVEKYGHYVWTSTVSYMLAMAIDKIQAARATGDAGPHVIGLWGVDMAANEELYTSQRAACQFFIQVLATLDIDFVVPPESDLCTPPPMYGVSEISHRAIKWTERKRELESRLAQANGRLEQAKAETLFLQGAIDDLDYHYKMWMHPGEDTLGFRFDLVFPEFEKARAIVAPVAPASVITAEALADGEAAVAAARAAGTSSTTTPTTPTTPTTL